MPFLPNSTLFPYTTLFRSVTDGTLSSNAATVTVAVASVNDAPVANDDALAATEDTPVTFKIGRASCREREEDWGALAISRVKRGKGGTATLNADGTVKFVAKANFHGAADFTYAVTDGTLSSNAATVTVAVASVNDAPVANDDALAATEDTPVTFTAGELTGNHQETDRQSHPLSRLSISNGK